MSAERGELRLGELHGHQRQRRGGDRTNSRRQPVHPVDRVDRLGYHEHPEHGSHDRRGDVERRPVEERIVVRPGRPERVRHALDPHSERNQNKAAANQRQRLPFRGKVLEVVEEAHERDKRGRDEDADDLRRPGVLPGLGELPDRHRQEDGRHKADIDRDAAGPRHRFGIHPPRARLVHGAVFLRPPLNGRRHERRNHGCNDRRDEYPDHATGPPTTSRGPQGSDCAWVVLALKSV